MVKKENIMPKIKKKISSFLSEEDGKITKASIFKTGFAVATLALIPSMAKIVDATITNTLTDSYNSATGVVTSEHTNHSNHSSHASHASHSSHGNHSAF